MTTIQEQHFMSVRGRRQADMRGETELYGRFSVLKLAGEMVTLKNSKLFSGLPAADLQALEQTAKLRSFEANQVVFQEGDPGDGLYLIVEGQVQISALVGNEDRRVLSQLGPDEFFGEMAVLDEEPRSATAMAEEPTRAFLIPRQALLDLLEHSPKLTFGLTREISQRMRDTNRAYIQQVLQAERLELVGRFARSIVHDFKNPLAIISFASDMLGSEESMVETRQLARQRIRKQVDRLSNMINELLEFTRGSSQSSVVLAQSDYARFLDQVLEDLRPEIEVKGVTVECEAPPPSVQVLLDPRRLTHVFYNLFNNAAEAMPNGGKILLRFRAEETRLVTEVEDTGEGIPEEVANRLFEPFASYGKEQGTGLGLSICKRIIEDHQGEIRARNEPGRGAIFSFSLRRNK